MREALHVIALGAMISALPFAFGMALRAAADSASPTQGPPGTPRRMERYTATTDSAGQASYTWTACPAAPDLSVIDGWIASGPTMVTGIVTASTLSTATVQAYETQAVVVGGQPYKAAAAGRSIVLRVMC